VDRRRPACASRIISGFPPSDWRRPCGARYPAGE
jgi:hypothetical protein